MSKSNPFASLGSASAVKKSKIEECRESIHLQLQQIFRISLNMEDTQEVVILPELIEIYPEMIFNQQNIAHAVEYRKRYEHTC